jgi:hypothetical protein
MAKTCHGPKDGDGVHHIPVATGVIMANGESGESEFGSGRVAEKHQAAVHFRAPCQANLPRTSLSASWTGLETPQSYA